MSEENYNQNQDNLPPKTISLPGNYYFDGDPGRVIDRVTALAKLDGDPQLQDKRQLLAKEVLSFCPVPFLDELIEALSSNTDAAMEVLRDKASHNEINLQSSNMLEAEKNQISALALTLLTEKIINTDSEKVLPILRFIQKYIEAQMEYQAQVIQELAELEKQRKQLTHEIRMKEEALAEDQRLIFIDFVGKLSSFES